MKYIYLLFFSLLIFSSCTIFYGIKSPQKISINELNLNLIQYKQDTTNSYLLNNILYKQYVKSLVSNSKKANALKQPLQIIYYENGEIVSYYINCNTGGFPNLKWNNKETLNTFIPKTQSDISFPLQLDSLKNYLHNYKKQFFSKKYTVVFMWSDFMKKQTKIFFDEFNKNLNLISRNDIEIIYVNMDNLYTE